MPNTDARPGIGPWLCIACLSAFLVAGCGGNSGSTPLSQGEARSGGGGGLVVVATTGMIADAARRVGGDRAVVTALMGPGVDPHLYQPTARDRAQLKEADLILYNGLHLEGRMVELFEHLARSKPAVAISRDLTSEQLLSWNDSGGMHDPHIWFDVALWQQAVATIVRALAQADPEHSAQYNERGALYLAELAELDRYCRARIAEIPEQQRVLITSHDAFHYFGRAYGLEVVGIQGISTDSEAGLKALTDAIDLIRERRVRAIFPETSVPRAAIERVAKDSGALLGTELYSDALGPPEELAGTYAGMIRFNVDAIVDALMGIESR
ncbi:MAG: metal ABC transporter solute-binding protein, Zn/Mn family [Planctomycetales bacterium]